MELLTLVTMGNTSVCGEFVGSIIVHVVQRKHFSKIL